MKARLMEVKVERQTVKKLERGGARVGIEFEMVVPGIDIDKIDASSRLDMQRDRPVHSIRDLVNFYDRVMNTDQDIKDFQRALTQNYQRWQQRQMTRDWKSNALDAVVEYIIDNDALSAEIQSQMQTTEFRRDPRPSEEKAEELLYQRARGIIRQAGSQLRAARAAWQRQAQIMYSEADWLESQKIHHASDVLNQYQIVWPYTREAVEDPEFLALGKKFSRALGGQSVELSGEYQGVPRDLVINQNTWAIEPDVSVRGDGRSQTESGMEFISPPVPLADVEATLDTVRRFAKKQGFYTNATTGLHVNVSVPGYSRENLDYVKLVLLIGDQHILEMFNRARGPATKYCQSALASLQQEVQRQDRAASGTQIAKILDQLRRGFNYAASRSLQEANPDRYYSINVHDTYVEFRSPGGDYLNPRLRQYSTQNLMRVIRTFCVALAAACDPQQHRELYLSRLREFLLPQPQRYYDPSDPENVREPRRFLARARGLRAVPVTDNLEAKFMSLVAQIMAGRISRDEIVKMLDQDRTRP